MYTYQKYLHTKTFREQAATLLFVFTFVCTPTLSLFPKITHAAGINLISNPGLETANSANVIMPEKWQHIKTGTNNASFTYPTAGNGSTRAVSIAISSYTSGDAKWFFDEVTVIPGQKYTFSNYSKATVSTNVVAHYTLTSGQTKDVTLGTVTGTNKWKKSSWTITIPSNASKMTVYHTLNKKGTLTVDDYTLSVIDTTKPNVVFVSPTAGSTISGTISLTGTATDAVGIASVQYYIDGNALGTALTNSPYTASFDTTSVANGVHTLRMDAKDTSGNIGTKSISVTVSNSIPDITPPQVSLTSPINGTTIGKTVSIIGVATDDVAVQTVQFLLDGTTFGPLLTDSPYTTSLDTTTITNGSHTIGMIATDSAGNTGTATDVTITVFNDTISPTATIISPLDGSTITGTISLEGTATDDTHVASVHFSVDGDTTDPLLTSTPYATSFDTTTLSNGVHTLGITATDDAGNIGTGTPITITVNNTLLQNENIIPNPSFEEVDPSHPTSPRYWNKGYWGVNTPVFTYPVNGVNGGNAARIVMTNYSSGDARWYPASIPVSGDTEYIYTQQYKSSVETVVDAEFSFPDGSFQYVWLGTLPPAENWTSFTATIAVPHGATGMTVYNAIGTNGTLDIDTVSIIYHPTLPLAERQFARGMVSLTFDDGWLSQYTQAAPILDAVNLKGGFYMITDIMDASVVPYNYMSPAQAKTLYDNGHEIGSHTLTHAHLTNIPVEQASSEISASLADLIAHSMPMSNTFVYPYGEYNDTIKQILKDAGYIGARSVENGHNYRDTDKFTLKIQEVKKTTTLAEFQTWIDEAVNNKTWLILMFHEVDAASSDSLSVTPKTLEDVATYLSTNNIDVVTMRQGLAQMIQ